ncbi:hypothetical protein [Trinickia terrae]|uniref:hypothetical protein n=1 Tax=Trinickia terrae TaxID=2571161 RepID=UPI00146B9B32|nr:hypothetical protein [Trinickia terrae]
MRIVMSAPQLAAALSGQSISQGEMWTNRLWGGLAVAGGVLKTEAAGRSSKRRR